MQPRHPLTCPPALHCCLSQVLRGCETTTGPCVFSGSKDTLPWQSGHPHSPDGNNEARKAGLQFQDWAPDPCDTSLPLTAFPWEASCSQGRVGVSPRPLPGPPRPSSGLSFPGCKAETLGGGGWCLLPRETALVKKGPQEPLHPGTDLEFSKHSRSKAGRMWDPGRMGAEGTREGVGTDGSPQE